MKRYEKFAKTAAVAFTVIAIGLGVQYLNARANEVAAASSKGVSSIAPLEMMQSVGRLPSTLVDHYI